jgi:pimeloyl-ACP methyl ester carboxylesterase
MDYMCCHRSLVSLASSLSALGHHVLRFDYQGTGDSAGTVTSGQFLRWMRDIDSAIAELLALSGPARISAVGLGLGALLATTALATGAASVDHLVLWDPEVSGSAYLADILAQERELLGWSKSSRAHDGDLLGFPFPSDLRHSLQLLDLRRNLLPQSPTAISLVVSERTPEYLELEAVLLARSTLSTIEMVTNPAAAAPAARLGIEMADAAIPAVVSVVDRA